MRLNFILASIAVIFGHAPLLATATSAYGADALSMSFTLKDNTGLPKGHEIYVIGASTAGGPTKNGLYLDKTGDWKAYSQESGFIPCWKMGTDITSINLDSTQTGMSGRVYFIVETPTQRDNATLAHCKNNSFGSNFFSYSKYGADYTAPTVGDILPDGSGIRFPPFVMIELAPGANNATADVSQVDLISFPVNVLTVPSINNGYAPSFKQGVGNSFDTLETKAGFSNMKSVETSFTTYFSNDQKHTGLLQQVSGSGEKQYIIENPGGYLGHKAHAVQPGSDTCAKPNTNPSPLDLNCDFSNLVKNYIWQTVPTWGTTFAWTGKINSGGALGGDSKKHIAPIAQDIFTGTAVSGGIYYPGTNSRVEAIKFTGAKTGFVAYVISPASINKMCNMGTNNPMPDSDQKHLCYPNSSIGYQIYAGAGALGPPPANQVANLISGTYGLLPGTHSVNYTAVATRLGMLLSTAFNRGVAGLKSCAYENIGDCWQDERLWYPTSTSVVENKQSYFLTSQSTPDLSQNKFALWLHTAVDASGHYLFSQPVSPMKWTGDANTTFSMGYGFSNDENPTPNPPHKSGATQPEVPSKWDNNVSYQSQNNYITLGPWVPGTVNISPNSQVNPPSDPLPTCKAITKDNLSILYPYTSQKPPAATLVCDSGHTVTNFVEPSKTADDFTWYCANAQGKQSGQCSSPQIPNNLRYPECASPPPSNKSLTSSTPKSDLVCQIGKVSSGYNYNKSCNPPSSWLCQTKPLIDGSISPNYITTSCQARCP